MLVPLARSRRRTPDTTPSATPRLASAPVPLRSGPELFGPRRVPERTGWRVGRQPLELRPVVPGDLAAVDALIRGLSARSRYLRFHTGLRRLTSHQLAGIVEVDHHARETLVVTTRDGRRSRVVALGQFVAVGGGAVELALVVADDWQGRGLGRRLARSLVRAAREEGHATVVALVLRDNAAALAVLEGLGRPRAVHGAGTSELELEIPLHRVRAGESGTRGQRGEAGEKPGDIAAIPVG